MNAEFAHPVAGSGQAVAMIWDGVLRWRAPADLGLAPPEARRACVLVPCEHVLLVVVDLPLSSHRQRLEAVPFAVEGMLAEPLANVHVALGPEVAPKRHLVGVVRHEWMSRWTETLAKAGLAGARILPDALALPARPEGWTVLARDGRALVRRSDLSGFAIPLDALEAAWRVAGRPEIVAYGDPLPGHLEAARNEPASPLAAADAVAAGFDLRQGAHAVSSFRASAFLGRAGWIAAVGCATLAALFVADTIALAHLAGERRQEARALLMRLAPDAAPGADIAAELARLLPSETADRPGRFLPFLASVSATLNAQGDDIAAQTLRYDAAERELRLDVTAQDLAALQRIEAAMIGAGHQAASGVATAEGGAAEVSIVVVDPDAGGGS